MKKLKNKYGFTLIELLAVVTLIGILMMVAIPSVSEVIDNSRRDSLFGTMKSYITSLKQDVINGNYDFADEKYTVYAVPIECIEMEKRGEDPYGQWMMANEDYWAYVLVQWDPVVKKYNYGFTFKDSVGWGLYPTSENNFNDPQTNIMFDLDLYRPRTGLYSNIAGAKDWAGFKINGHTQLQVLETSYSGSEGNGKTVCTLVSPGKNYEQTMDERSNRYINGKPCYFVSGNISTIGSKVSCGGENFYYIGEKDNAYILLAEHQIRTSLENPGQDANSEGGYLVESFYYLNGAIGSSLNPLFGKSYPTYIYGNFGGNWAYPYMRAYEDYLEQDKAVKSAAVTIPAREDLIEYLKCTNVNNVDCNASPYLNIIHTDYMWWTGTAVDSYSVLNYMPSSKKFGWGRPDGTEFMFKMGIRPLLFIEKSDLETS